MESDRARERERGESEETMMEEEEEVVVVSGRVGRVAVAPAIYILLNFKNFAFVKLPSSSVVP